MQESTARRFRALVLEGRGDRLLVAMADPLDREGFERCRRLWRVDGFNRGRGRARGAPAAIAVRVGASDIHIEPLESGLQIRVRVDGVLPTQTQAEKRIGAALAHASN